MAEQEVILDDIVYIVQGMRFKLKPTSIKNREEAGRKLAETKALIDEQIRKIKSNIRRERLLEEKEMQGKDWVEQEIPEEYDVSDIEPLNLKFEMFCALTDGEHEKLIPEEFDVRYADRARADFLPEEYATNMTLESFLRL